LASPPSTFVAILVIAVLAVVVDAVWNGRAPDGGDRPRVEDAADLAPAGGAPVGEAG